jgi:hypothetical protein
MKVVVQSQDMRKEHKISVLIVGVKAEIQYRLNLGCEALYNSVLQTLPCSRQAFGSSQCNILN